MKTNVYFDTTEKMFIVEFKDLGLTAQFDTMDEITKFIQSVFNNIKAF